jgi:hypothetical protein
VSSFWGELSLLDPCVELGVELVEGTLEWGIDGAQGWKSGGQTRAQDSIVGARERSQALMDKLQIIEPTIIGRNGCCMVSGDEGTSSSDRREIECPKPGSTARGKKQPA